MLVLFEICDRIRLHYYVLLNFEHTYLLLSNDWHIEFLQAQEMEEITWNWLISKAM